MEFKEVMKHRKRMCKTIQKDAHYHSCPIGSYNNGKGEMCDRFVIEYPSEAEQIIIKWITEHPAKTIMDDFFEKHPNALKDNIGQPCICARLVGYGFPDNTSKEFCVSKVSCKQCWMRPIEE